MYNNIGKKIKILAMVIGWLGLAAGIVAWFILITNTWKNGRYITADDGAGWAALGAGVALLLSSWFLYGFGELIVKVTKIADGKPAAQEATKVEEKAFCTVCGQPRIGSAMFCNNCGNKFTN